MNLDKRELGNRKFVDQQLSLICNCPRMAQLDPKRPQEVVFSENFYFFSLGGSSLLDTIMVHTIEHWESMLNRRPSVDINTWSSCWNCWVRRGGLSGGPSCTPSPPSGTHKRQLGATLLKSTLREEKNFPLLSTNFSAKQQNAPPPPAPPFWLFSWPCASFRISPADELNVKSCFSPSLSLSLWP